MAWSVTAKSPYGCFQLLPSLSSRPWGTFKSLISCFLTATSGNSLHSSWRGALWLWYYCVAKCPQKTWRLWMTLGFPSPGASAKALNWSSICATARPTACSVPEILIAVASTESPGCTLMLTSHSLGENGESPNTWGLQNTHTHKKDSMNAGSQDTKSFWRSNVAPFSFNINIWYL